MSWIRCVLKALNGFVVLVVLSDCFLTTRNDLCNLEEFRIGTKGTGRRKFDEAPR
jgi:hypothetical protein